MSPTRRAKARKEPYTAMTTPSHQPPLFHSEEEEAPTTPQAFPPGTLVMSRTSFPSVTQPWIHSFYVGTAEEPDDDSSRWNGRNSERQYLEHIGAIPVRYEQGRGYERIPFLKATT